MEICEIKLNRQKVKLLGVKLFENNCWIVLNDSPGDYVLDGYKLINKQFVKNESKLSEDNIKYQILNLKFKDQTFEYLNSLNFDNYKNLLSCLETQKSLIEISLGSEDYILIGKIVNVFEKSFTIEKIGVNTTILGIENIKYSVIRSIGLKTDYLKSLELYLNWKEKAPNRTLTVKENKN